MSAPAAQLSGWQARLELEYTPRAQRTVISRRQHLGPLVIQKPFYPEGPVCHTYLLHPPGGVVGGDQLQLDVRVTPEAHALMTTPAAGKFYRSDGRHAVLSQQFQVEAGGILEWLPQETILFAGCHVAMQTIIQLQQQASFIGWEIVCLGRPASNETYQQGECRQRFEIWRDGQPLLLERSLLQGDSELLSASWGLQGYTVSGTLLAVNADESIVQAVRKQLAQCCGQQTSVTLINDVLICRALAQHGEALRKTFIYIWQIIRPLLLQREACVPRIWNT